MAVWSLACSELKNGPTASGQVRGLAIIVCPIPVNRLAGIGPHRFVKIVDWRADLTIPRCGDRLPESLQPRNRARMYVLSRAHEHVQEKSNYLANLHSDAPGPCPSERRCRTMRSTVNDKNKLDYGGGGGNTSVLVGQDVGATHLAHSLAIAAVLMSSAVRADEDLFPSTPSLFSAASSNSRGLYWIDDIAARKQQGQDLT